MIRERRERVARGWSKLGCASRARPVGRLRDQANGPRERDGKKKGGVLGRKGEWGTRNWSAGPPTGPSAKGERGLAGPRVQVSILYFILFYFFKSFFPIEF